ncbi:MAG TPA: OsmC family protein [Candidatus Acidoferrales bacterium]
MQEARVRWVEDDRFLATTPSGHAVPFDSNRQTNLAPGPMEMLLVALGACTATDVVTILKKKRQPLAGLEVAVRGERAATPPTVWTKLEIHYRVRGRGLDEKAVRDAIELSENKYCSVAAMLKKTAPIRFDFEMTEA